MKCIITPQQAQEIAFTGQDYLPRNALTESWIDLAQERFLRPVVGEELCQAMAEGAYSDFVSDFVAPVIAFGARFLLLPHLRFHLAPGGVMHPSGGATQPLSEEEFHHASLALRNHLEGLRCRLDRALERLYRAGEIPAYDPNQNIRKRCRIHGTFIQTL